MADPTIPPADAEVPPSDAPAAGPKRKKKKKKKKVVRRVVRRTVRRVPRPQAPVELTRRARVVLALACALALGLCAYKWAAMGYALTSQRAPHTWLVEYKLNVRGSDKPGSVRVAVPVSEPGQAVQSEQVLAQGHDSAFVQTPGGRALEVKTRGERERFVVYYQAVVETGPAADRDAADDAAQAAAAGVADGGDAGATAGAADRAPHEGAPDGVGDADAPSREAADAAPRDTADADTDAAPRPEKRWLRLGHRTEAERAELREMARTVAGDATEDLARATALLKHVVTTYADERSPRKQSLLGMIRSQRGSLDGRVGLFVDLCRAARIGARRVVGYDLGGASPGESFAWAEVFAGGAWVGADVRDGTMGSIGDDVIAVLRGDALVTRTRDVEHFTAGVNALRARGGPADDRFRAEYHGFSALVDRMSLSRLPLETQRLVSAILLVPLAALMVTFFRIVLGFNTIGTFLPVILSLSFRSTELVAGLALVTLVVAVGALVSRLVVRVHLPRVARSALLVSVVVSVMVGLCLVGEATGLYRFTSVALFPIVIMTLLVDRLTAYASTHGPMKSLRAYIGTCAVAALSYAIIETPAMQHAFFAFPELVTCVGALIVLTGAFRGPSLMARVKARFGGGVAPGGAAGTPAEPESAGPED